MRRKRRRGFRFDASYPPEPYRGERPSMEELGGLSEFRATAASAAENLGEGGDPMRPMASEHMPSSREEDIVVSPDELGVNYILHALQGTLPMTEEDGELSASSTSEFSDPDFDLEADEEDGGGLDDDDRPIPLTTHLEDGSDHEREVSRRAEGEVRKRVRARLRAGKPPHLH